MSFWWNQVVPQAGVLAMEECTCREQIVKAP